MPARGDHDARRRDVSDAVWRVLAARGVGGLTIRAVAAEMNASTGLVSHYFPTKQALLEHARGVAEDRTDARLAPDGDAPRGLAGLRSALLAVLAPDPEVVALNRAWVSFWDAALADPALGGQEAERYERWRAKLRSHLEAARHLGELPPDADPDALAATAAAFTHGLVVQCLFDPERFPPERRAELLDGLLDGFPAKTAESG